MDWRSGRLARVVKCASARSVAVAKVIRSGRALDTSYMRRLLPKLAAAAKLDKPVSPHLLRHTRAREWSDAGFPVADIQHALGHKNLATTSIYLARLAPAGMGAGQNGRRSN